MRIEEAVSWDLGKHTWGGQAKFDFFLCYFVIRVRYCKLMREEGYASWDRAQGHMGRSGKVDGVQEWCRERWGNRGNLAGISVGSVRAGG
nr:hypothetical protein [Tanacetum cinerariifolium]